MFGLKIHRELKYLTTDAQKIGETSNFLKIYFYFFKDFIYLFDRDHK